MVNLEVFFAQNAIEALSTLPGVPDEFKKTIAPDLDRLVITGHSNGGQGAWWMMSHFPDRVIAGNFVHFTNFTTI